MFGVHRPPLPRLAPHLRILRSRGAVVTENDAFVARSGCG
ncbi:protein of unknown function [Microbacterium sp. Nx66]|nr:protein of unknown function [Microbacterium sp. Nx66]